MRLLKKTAPISVSVAIIITVTAILFYFKDGREGGQHLVFFYLLPTAFVAILFGSVVSMLCAIAATIAAAFFLYDPIFSFYVSDPREAGELIFFAVTALIGAKCTADVTHPPEKNWRCICTEPALLEIFGPEGAMQTFTPFARLPLLGTTAQT